MTALPENWSDWNVIGEIGRGSYSVVYEAARKDDPSVRCAIKLVTIPQDDSEYDDLIADGFTTELSRSFFSETVRDFTREIRLMEHFKGMQNIVSIEDYKVLPKEDGIGSYIFIRMELLSSLEKYISDKVLSEDEVIQIGIDICTALEFCHESQIIHRDIKPANIFVNDRLGTQVFYKLGDFGIARNLEGKTQNFSSKGTPNYMAPEVAANMKYDLTADIYSLGLTLYWLTNGNRLPFFPQTKLYSPAAKREALQRRLCGEAIEPPLNASSGLSAVILKALQYQPADRYRSAGEMKKALLQLRGAGESQAAKPRKTAVQDPRPAKAEADRTKGKGRKVLILAAAAAALALAAWGIITLAGPSALPVPAEETAGMPEGGTLPGEEETIPETAARAPEEEAPETEQPPEENGAATAEEPVFEYEALPDGTALLTGYRGNASRIELPDSVDGYTVSGLGSGLFTGDGPEEVAVPDGVVSIGDYAFRSCSRLVSVQLPSGLRELGSGAFSGCSNLKSIRIPDNVNYIGDNPFAGCPALEEIKVSEGNTRFYVSEGVLFDRRDRRLICYPAEKRQAFYSVPAGIQIVGKNAFRGNSELVNLVLPESLLVIGESAFAECRKLLSAEIPEGTADIGNGALSGCSSLRSVHLPSALLVVSEELFAGCENLTEVNIPESVQEIRKNSFSGCIRLRKLYIPENVCLIEDAFGGCDRLTVSVQPGSYAEQYCSQTGLLFTTGSAESAPQNVTDAEAEVTAGEPAGEPAEETFEEPAGEQKTETEEESETNDTTAPEENEAEAAAGILRETGGVYPEKSREEFDADSPALYTGKMRSDFGGSIWAERTTDDNRSKLATCGGKQVDILYVGLRWLIVRYNDIIGYAKREYVDFSSIKASDPENTPPINQQKQAYTARTASVCHVRKTMTLNRGDEDDGNNWVILQPGSELSIWKMYNGWAVVVYMREYGYIDPAELTDLTPMQYPDGEPAPGSLIAAYASYYKLTQTETNLNRIHNIAVAGERASVVLQPGEKFDANKTLGPFKQATGYKQAAVLVDGNVKTTYGGGTNQVSSTLYNAVLQLPGIRIDRRSAHGGNGASYLPIYCDAAIGNSSLNLVFTNQYDYPVRIEAVSRGDGVILVKIYRGDQE